MISEKITKKDIEITAALSKLSFEDSELEALCEGLEELLVYADVLLDGGAETVGIQSAGDPLRDDEAQSFGNTAALVAAAPTSREGFVTVPQAVKL